MATAETRPLYDVHPGVAMVQKWVAELKGKTGRSLEEWLALVKKEGPKNEKERREWLKTKHKLGTNSAWWIAERADGKAGRGGRRAAPPGRRGQRGEGRTSRRGVAGGPR